MRPLPLLSLLLLSFLFYNTATAIRLQQGFMQIVHQNIQEEKSSRLIKQSNINGGFVEVIECKEEEGHCKGINRKLTTTVISSTSTTTISTTSSKSEENGGNKSKANGREHEKLKINSNSEHEEVIKNHDEYVDIMDYSPAKRKPPIHN